MSSQRTTLQILFRTGMRGGQLSNKDPRGPIRKRISLQTLVRSGIRGVQLSRSDPSGPVGKYIAKIKINGEYQSG